MSNIIASIIVVVVAFGAFVLGALIARRKGFTKQGDVVVRCRRGHLFTTVWTSRLSKSRLDLGFARIQRCPQGNHLTIVTPVDGATLTKEEKKQAKQLRDDARA
jgi:hypothetical protein